MTRKWPQIVAAICICFGSMCTGIMIGWPNTIDGKLRDQEYGFEVNDTEMAIIGSTMTLGAAVTCFPVGFLLNIIGRKWTCLLTVIPFTIGWLSITASKDVSVVMVYVGRFFIGLAGGTFCIAAPLYTMEIAETSIRGALGSFFQLFVTIGILVAFVLGWQLSLLAYNIICAALPFLFFITFLFQPESPVIIVKKGKIDKAEKTLKYFRGKDYDASAEIKAIQADLEQEAIAKAQCRDTMKKKNAKKAMLICFMLMFFQQFSGINAVMFYSSDIFKSAKTDLEAGMQSVIIGVIQVVITVIACATIDRCGRKLLMMISGAMMGLSLVLLGVFFTMKERIYEEGDSSLDGLGWLPLLSLCIYIIGFSVGFGPIPWVAVGEFFPPEIKPPMAAAAGTLNWLFAFVVAMLFPPIKGLVGGDICFYFFAFICFASIAFVLIIMPEPKNKSFAEIQEELSK